MKKTNENTVASGSFVAEEVQSSPLVLRSGSGPVG